MAMAAWNGVSLVTEPWTCDRKLVASERARVFWVTQARTRKLRPTTRSVFNNEFNIESSSTVISERLSVEVLVLSLRSLTDCLLTAT